MSLTRIPGNGPDSGKESTQGFGHVPASWLARLKVYGAAGFIGLAIGLYALIAVKHGGGDFASMYLADARLLLDRPIYWAPPELDPSYKSFTRRAAGVGRCFIEWLRGIRTHAPKPGTAAARGNRP